MYTYIQVHIYRGASTKKSKLNGILAGRPTEMAQWIKACSANLKTGVQVSSAHINAE